MRTVQTVNIGALSAWYQFGHKEDYKNLVPAVSGVLAHMQENIGPFIIAREIYDFYIKNETLTMRTILKDVSKDKAKKIYDDPIYGMKNWYTLKEWLNPTTVKPPRSHPKYTELMNYFGLTPDEMNSIYQANSVLQMLASLGQCKYFE